MKKKCYFGAPLYRTTLLFVFHRFHVLSELTSFLSFLSLFSLLYFTVIFYINRWDTVNRIGGIIGSLIIAITSGKHAYDMDNGMFVLRPWWLLTGIFFLMSFHLFLFPNPMHTSASLLEKEKKKAEAKAKKGK